MKCKSETIQEFILVLALVAYPIPSHSSFKMDEREFYAKWNYSPVCLMDDDKLISINQAFNEVYDIVLDNCYNKDVTIVKKTEVSQELFKRVVYESPL